MRTVFCITNWYKLIVFMEARRLAMPLDRTQLPGDGWWIRYL